MFRIAGSTFVEICTLLLFVSIVVSVIMWDILALLRIPVNTKRGEEYKKMREIIWYNVGMPKTLEKKTENFSLKVPSSLMETLSDISEKEDRPLGYVGRELMIRGLRLYRKDGRLRDDQTQTVAILKEKAR